VNINDLFLECTQKITLQNAHKTGQSHPFSAGFTERGDVGCLGGFVQFGAEFPWLDKPGRQPKLRRALQYPRIGDIAGYQDNVRRQRPGGAGFGQRDEVRPFAGAEHGQFDFVTHAVCPKRTRRRLNQALGQGEFEMAGRCKALGQVANVPAAG